MTAWRSPVVRCLYFPAMRTASPSFSGSPRPSPTRPRRRSPCRRSNSASACCQRPSRGHARGSHEPDGERPGLVHGRRRDDPPGRSGFAHLFEHLMFKSTKYLKAEQFDRLTEDVGGMNNASTREDVTNYFARRAVESSRAPAVGRSRAHAEPRRRRRQLQVRARGGAGRVSPAHAREPVRTLPRIVQSALVCDASVPPRRDRQHRRARGRLARRRARVPSHVLPARQRGADRRRRLRSEAARRVGRQVLRADRAAATPIPRVSATEPARTKRRALQGDGPERAAAGRRAHVAWAAARTARMPRR